MHSSVVLCRRRSRDIRHGFPGFRFLSYWHGCRALGEKSLQRALFELPSQLVHPSRHTHRLRLAKRKIACGDCRLCRQAATIHSFDCRHKQDVGKPAPLLPRLDSLEKERDRHDAVSLVALSRILLGGRGFSLPLPAPTERARKQKGRHQRRPFCHRHQTGLNGYFSLSAAPAK